MKRFLSFALVALLIFPLILALPSCNNDDMSGDTIVLNVYNWGEYMPLSEDEHGYDLNAAFEKWYYETYGQKIRVNYDMFSSNEELRAKLEANAVSYDIIIPSDYMIDYFVNNDMLLEIDFDNIPNYKNIGEDFKNLYYDPENKYSVPYSYATIGIIYNAEVVDPADVKAMGWEIMWSEKYRDAGILQFNNSRDAFGIAMYNLGIDVNTTDRSLWDRAYNKLVQQQDVIYGRVMDEIYNFMEVGETALGAYYAGDYFTMVDNQVDGVDLQFYTPDNTNVFVDAMCIPKTCRNKQAAEAYINFILGVEAGTALADYLYYGTPNTAVRENPEYLWDDELSDEENEEWREEVFSVIYPDNFDFKKSFNKNAYRDLNSLDPDIYEYMIDLWEKLIIQ